MIAFHIVPNPFTPLVRGGTVYVNRTKDWAFLPAVRWGDDKIVNAPLPLVDPGLWGWWEMTGDGGWRQILRDSFAEEGQYGLAMDSYILQTDDEWVVGKVLRVGSKAASFEVLAYCQKETLRLVTGLMHEVPLKEKREQIAIIRTCANFPTTLRWGNFCVHLESEQGINQLLRELVNHLPHGSGWNGTWSIEQSGLNMFKVSIDYDFLDDIGWATTWEVGWNISKNDKWFVHEYIRPKPEVDSWEYLEDKLATELEECLNEN